MKRFSFDDFVAKAKKIHGEKYQYPDQPYINRRTKFEIVCPKHGSFWQTPGNHLSGFDCRKCGYERVTGINKSSFESFVEQANKIHGNRYEYPQQEYVNSKTKLKIICHEHGEFLQSANPHLKGSGCPTCGHDSEGEKSIEIWLKSRSIEYIRQKRFANCFNKRSLPFDFFLPQCKTLIEFDGEQHFQVIDHWGGMENYKRIQKNDEIKNQFAKDWGFDLIRIKFGSNIDAILSDRLGEFAVEPDIKQLTIW